MRNGYALLLDRKPYDNRESPHSMEGEGEGKGSHSQSYQSSQKNKQEYTLYPPNEEGGHVPIDSIPPGTSKAPFNASGDDVLLIAHGDLKPGAGEMSFEARRIAALGENIRGTFRGLEEHLRTQEAGGLLARGYATSIKEFFQAECEAARREIAWNPLIEGKITAASKLGYWWDYETPGYIWTDIQWQKKFVNIARFLVRVAQYTEIGFVTANIVLSIYGSDDMRSPTFLIPFISTLITAVGALEMNWNFVSPEEDIRDAINPAPVQYHVSTYEHERKFIFNTRELGQGHVEERPIYDEGTLGYNNVADARFHRVVMRYSKYENNNFYKSPNYLNSWLNRYGAFCNNIFAPFGNWTAIGLVTSQIGNPTGMLIVGLATFFIIFASGGSYYAVTNAPLMQKADESFISSRNPISRAYYVSNCRTFTVKLLEYVVSSVTRALGIILATLVGYNYLGFRKIMPENNYHLLTMCTIGIIGFGAFHFSMITRAARTFAPIVGPLTFPTPFGKNIDGSQDSQTITNPKILETFDALPYVKSQFSTGDFCFLAAKAFLLSACWAIPTYMLMDTSEVEERTKYIVPSVLQLLTTYTYYSAEKQILLFDRASKIISLIRGRSPFLRLSGEKIRFAYIIVLCDTISRVFSRSGSVMALSFIASLNMSHFQLFIASTLLMIPSARVDFQYFLGAVLKNTPGMIEDIRNAKNPENRNCKTIFISFITKVLTYPLSRLINKNEAFDEHPQPVEIPADEIAQAADSINLDRVQRQLEAESRSKEARGKEEKNYPGRLSARNSAGYFDLEGSINLTESDRLEGGLEESDEEVEEARQGCLGRATKRVYAFFHCRGMQTVAEPLPAVRKAYAQVRENEQHFYRSFRNIFCCPRR